MKTTDLVFGGVSIVFLIGVINILLSPDAAVPLLTSVPNTVGMLALTWAYWKIGSKFGTIATAIGVVAWIGVIVFRHT